MPNRNTHEDMKIEFLTFTTTADNDFSTICDILLVGLLRKSVESEKRHYDL